MTMTTPHHIWRRIAVVHAVALLATLTVVQPQICIGQESPPLPPPASPEPEAQLPTPAGAPSNELEAHPECKFAPVDNPLFTLNTDISVRDKDSNPVPADKLPFSCASLKPPQQRVMSIGTSCDTCYPGYCDLLSMACFCHKPLYFNDDSLERCGVKKCCCQPCASALCFYGGALLMPVRVCCECPCSCVQSSGCCCR